MQKRPFKFLLFLFVVGSFTNKPSLLMGDIFKIPSLLTLAQAETPLEKNLTLQTSRSVAQAETSLEKNLTLQTSRSVAQAETPLEKNLTIRTTQSTSSLSKSKILLAGNSYNSPVPASLSEKNYKANEAPHPLKNIKVTENIGSFIDLNLKFTNEEGQSVPLKTYFNKKPVLMTVIYYNCPSLCNFHLNGLWTALNDLKWKKYEFVVVSMDHNEGPSLAYQKKQNYLKEFPNVPENQIHFLTGSESQIQLLTQSLGFPFYWDEATQQFAHSPVAYSLSHEGLISRYLYGISFLSQTLKLALLEAAQGKLGNVIDRALLFCYRFNPEEKKYSLYGMNIMKTAGGLMVFILILFLAPFWIRERKHAT